MSGWRITRLRGELALTFDHGGKRRRFTLGTSDPSEAKRLAPAVFAELTRPKGTTVADLWQAYTTDKAGRSVVTTMKYTWKALEPHFGKRQGEAITKAECLSYAAARRRAGISDGSIHTELGHLRTVLVWARKSRLIKDAPEIDRPRKPDPKERYLTREEARKILDAAALPHVRLAIHLMLATAARVSAVLSLTWKRVDFGRRLITLRDPDDAQRRKGRAVVPINDTLFAALQEARKGALSDYVVEWGGERVKSIKRSIATAADNAGLTDVSPHVFRHTAAVWMAEAGIPMSEISQYLGHSNMSVTVKVYARYSPDHLRRASKSLEMPLYEVPAGTVEPVNLNGRENDAGKR
jgi:integrase